jgi:hypothetical protein
MKYLLFNGGNVDTTQLTKLIIRIYPLPNPISPCGGGLEYLHRSVVPARRKRRQKGNAVSDETVKYGYWDQWVHCKLQTRFLVREDALERRIK